MASLIKPRFISPELADDKELANESAQRIAEDLTFLKLDGSRKMQGDLDMNDNDAKNVKKLTNKTSITVPTFTTASNNGMLLLNSNSTSVHFVTGTQVNYSIILPDATTIPIGTNYELYNRTDAPIMVKYSDGTNLGTLAQESVTSLILQDNSDPVGIFSPFSIEIAQAAGILSYNLDSSVSYVTNSNMDSAIPNFSITPIAGNYAIYFNADASSKNNNAFNRFNFYKGGTQVLGTERVVQSVSSNFVFLLALSAVVSFNGSENLEVQVRVSVGNFTINDRSLVMLRLGPQII